ncbi:macrocin O-methyltransferase [Pseudomonadales bacterium]|nr:macrocin O-methyltransferase [Pseudomonadales bacterium]
MVDEADAYATWEAVRYVNERCIEGAMVECGVWRGGVSILMAERLRLDENKRSQFLYDTFEGMSEPTDRDWDKHGNAAKTQLAKTSRRNTANDVWAFASIEDVRQNFKNLGVSTVDVDMIKGKVEDTIPSSIPDKIAVLRLDTDWYESTMHELEHLYPRLSPGGVLLIDDYGYWAGCKEAVDEFFSRSTPRPYMSFMPSGSVVAIKH